MSDAKTQWYDLGFQLNINGSIMAFSIHQGKGLLQKTHSRDSCGCNYCVSCPIIAKQSERTQKVQYICI